MLYLPAIQIGDDGTTPEVRIPCGVDHLVTLCQFCIHHEAIGQAAHGLFAHSPGLLLYSLARFFGSHGRAAHDLTELMQWVDRAFFSTVIQHDTLQPVPQLDRQQKKRITQWTQRGSRKRAMRFLATCTRLTGKSAQEFLDAVWSDNFEWLPAAVDDRPGTTASIDSASAGLVIAQLWNACGSLQQLRSNFARQLQRKKLLAMKQLAYGASHEINNPLANIATRAQTLLSEETNASKRQRLAVIYAQAMRAHEMISDMMLFAQPPDVSFESVEIKPLIEKVVGELGSELKQHEIVVGVRQYPDCENCELDSTHFAVAVRAMLLNCIEAIGCGGEIRIQIWKRDDNTIGISVADDGCGIEGDIVDQIFDPFFSGREAGRGLGFGLSKVWRIVDLHDGEINLEADARWSTRFVISLPQRRAVSAAPVATRIDNSQAA